MKLAAFWNSVRGDKVIWRIVLILAFMSILIIYSSTSPLVSRNQSIFYYLVEQTFYVGLSLFLVYLFHNIPVGFYRKIAFLALAFSILLLLLTLAFPAQISTDKQAYRWITVPLIGLNLQTSDVAKIGLIIYLAKVLEDNKLDTFKQFGLKILLPVAVVCLLVVYGNFSTAALIGVTAISIMYIGGVKRRYLLYTLGMVFTGVLMILLIGTAFPKAFPRVTTAVARVTRFVDKNPDASSNDNFQAEQAKIAVASGGFVGVGPGNSTQRYILPQAYSDFVYAIVAEEYGLVGALVFLLLYLWLLFRAVLIAKKCTKKFPMIVVLGLMLLIVFQAMINMGVSVGVFPVTGQTLPLISKGGTSMVFMSVAFGIILAISRAADEKDMAYNPELTEATE